MHRPSFGARMNQHLDITLLLSDTGMRDMNGRAMGEAAIMRTAHLKILFMNEYVKKSAARERDNAWRRVLAIICRQRSAN